MVPCFLSHSPTVPPTRLFLSIPGFSNHWSPVVSVVILQSSFALCLWPKDCDSYKLFSETSSLSMPTAMPTSLPISSPWMVLMVSQLVVLFPRSTITMDPVSPSWPKMSCDPCLELLDSSLLPGVLAHVPQRAVNNPPNTSGIRLQLHCPLGNLNPPQLARQVTCVSSALSCLTLLELGVPPVLYQLSRLPSS